MSVCRAWKLLPAIYYNIFISSFLILLFLRLKWEKSDRPNGNRPGIFPATWKTFRNCKLRASIRAHIIYYIESWDFEKNFERKRWCIWGRIKILAQENEGCVLKLNLMRFFLDGFNVIHSSVRRTYIYNIAQQHGAYMQTDTQYRMELPIIRLLSCTYRYTLHTHPHSTKKKKKYLHIVVVTVCCYCYCCHDRCCCSLWLLLRGYSDAFQRSMIWYIWKYLDHIQFARILPPYFICFVIIEAEKRKQAKQSITYMYKHYTRCITRHKHKITCTNTYG